MAKEMTRKSLRANFGWLIAERGWRMGVGVFVSVLVTRYLGPERFGVLNFAFSLYAIASAVTGLGIDDVLARELARRPNEARRLLAIGIKVKLAGATLAFVGVMAVAWVMRIGDPNRLWIVGWVALGLFFLPADVIELWFQSREHMRPPVVVRQMALLVAAAVRVGLVVSDAPLWCFAAATAMELALVAVGLGGLWWRDRGGIESGPVAGETSIATDEALMLWKEGWPLLFSGFFVVVTLHMDRILLVRLAGETATGIYAAGARLTELLLVFPVALGAVFLPRMSAAHGRSDEQYVHVIRRAGQTLLGLTVPLAVAGSVIAPWLLPRLLGEAYRASAEVWRVQVWTLVFVSIVSLRSRLWVVEGRTIWILVLAAITAVLNLAGDWWLIPKMGALGAAWAAVGAWGISALILPWMAAGPSQSMRRWCGLAKLE